MLMPSLRFVESLLRVVLVVGALAFPAGSRDVQAGQEAPTPEARARTVVELISGGRYAEAFEWFTPQMKDALPLERLSATWKTLAEQAGPFRHQVATSVTPRGVLQSS